MIIKVNGMKYRTTFDINNVQRFETNSVIKYLVDSGQVNLNKLRIDYLNGKFSYIDYMEFVMQTGYSVSGFADLFQDAIGYKGVFDKHGTHHKNEAGHKEEKEVVHAHNPHVVAHEVEPPKESEYKKHPRWAMIEDYMSGDHKTKLP
jgi:hypothetical protein